MAGHTPGPWHLQRMRQEGLFSIGMGTFYATGLIGEANARLIAAAPELLEALTDAERWLLRITDEVLDGEGSRPQYNAVRDQVRAAIAKATTPSP